MRVPEHAFEPGAFDQPRFVRDLTSLLALPAFWSGTEPAFVLRTLFEALEALLAVDVCYGVVATGAGERLQILRVNRQPVAMTDAGWAPIIALADIEPAGEAIRDIDMRGRLLRCVRLPIGYVGETGRIVVGSWQASFPDMSQHTTLTIALSLTGAGLETARAIRERDDAQRAKDEFLAMLGHELRNPLAPIVTALQLMAVKSGGKRSREQEIIERQVRHLRTLVDDLLDVSRITRGKIELDIRRVTLGDIVARALETVTPLIEERRHDVQVHVPDGLAIDADPTRMTQVVANLLTNAARYTPPGGALRVLGASDGPRVTLRVVDNGAGLSSDLISRVFDLFVQGRRNLARSEGGLGIGLALVKRLVQAHGGTVVAHSDGPGRGSEFAVTLPRAAVPADDPVHAAAADERFEPGAAPGVQVLVVDDNRDAADLAASVLQDAGHHVEVAYTGFEALERAARTLPDVVILDIGLPDMDGYSVAAELRARHPGVPFVLIALTGYGLKRDRARSGAAGFAAHLVKPLDALELTAMLQRVLDAAGRPASDAPRPGASLDAT